MRKRSELFFNLLLVPLDVLAVLASFVVAYIIRVEYSLKPTVYEVPGWGYLYALVALMPFIIIFFALAGLYRYESVRSRWREYSQVVIAVSASTMFLIIVDFFSTKPLFPSKAVVFYGFMLAIILVIIERFVINIFQRWLFRFGIGIRQVVVVGVGRIADDVTYTLQRSPGYYLVRVLERKKDTLEKLQRIVKKQHIDELFIADKTPAEVDQLDYIRFAHNHHIVYKFIPSLAGIYQTRSQPSLYADYPVLEIVRTPLDGWWRIYKTVVDYMGAILGTILLSPLYLVIAVVIKLTDGGKVFYRHERIGRHGRIIRVWKFRSMYMEYSTGGAFSGKTDLEILREIGDEKIVDEFRREQKLKHDPRVTPIGRFLRATSLDELPQLFNVLRGELSLIGPRPVTKDELKRYQEKAPTFLLIKPGITGLWQVSGRNDVSYDERVKLDVYYVENWKASLDMRILFRTIGVIFRRKGY
jgi:exopolysaccharide biosynthesis polyprenyl glycosylphosphotransferase